MKTYGGLLSGFDAQYEYNAVFANQMARIRASDESLEKLERSTRIWRKIIRE